MQLKQYQHRSNGTLVLAERITSQVVVTRDGRVAAFTHGDYVVVHPGDSGAAVVSFVHRHEFEPFYEETDQTATWTADLSRPSGREQRVVDLDDRPDQQIPRPAPPEDDVS